MSEVLIVISKLILLLGLFYFAWVDYNTKLVNLRAILLFGCSGIILQVLMAIEEKKYLDMIAYVFGGASVGMLICLIAFISKESIGKGDGLLFLVTGIFLGVSSNAALLLGTFLLAGSYSVICLLCKRKGRNDKVALAPFMLCAFVIFVL